MLLNKQGVTPDKGMRNTGMNSGVSLNCLCATVVDPAVYCADWIVAFRGRHCRDFCDPGFFIFK